MVDGILGFILEVFGELIVQLFVWLCKMLWYAPQWLYAKIVHRPRKPRAVAAQRIQ